MKDRKGPGITGWILIGLVAGIVVGGAQYQFLPASLNAALIKYVHDPVGRVFLNGIRLLVVPLVLVSLTLGTARIGHLSKIGRIGGRIILLYIGTTACAITIGYGLAWLVRPGSGLSIPTDAAFQGAAAPNMLDFLVNIVPINPIESLASGNMLQIIFFSLLCGIAISSLQEKTKKLVSALDVVDQVIQKMVGLIMLFAPIGVFGLMAKVVAGQGGAVFLPLLKYMFTIIGALIIQGIIVYPSILRLFARLNPLQFYRNISPAMLVAFTTSSSNATLPVTLQTAKDRLGVHESVGAFTLSLGATLNMDGTAIMQGVATVFIAGVYDIPLHASAFFTVVLMATLASIGTAGVPGVGLIMLSMVLRQIGLPIEGIGIILGVDRLLDMSRTMINVCGDLACTAVVAQKEGEFDEHVFNSPNEPWKSPM